MRRLVSLSVLLSLSLAACAGRKTLARFTPDRVAQLREGMTSAELLELFGDPTSVEPFRSGGFAGQKYVYNVGPQVTDVNFFVFDVTYGEPRLRQWFLGRTAK